MQIEIIVNENIENVESEANKIKTFSEEQFDGIGFKEIYIRTDENKIGLNDRKISISDFENILINLNFEKISYVLTGYGNSYKTLHKNCFAFSKSETNIFYEFKNNIIENHFQSQVISSKRKQHFQSLSSVTITQKHAHPYHYSLPHRDL